MNWDGWTPQMHATLMFIVKDGQVLLIEKRRGIGAGKINGPGGKIDPGETALECAIRETQEELLITPLDPVKVGELWFAMSDIPDIHCHVYLAHDFSGTPTVTDEAIPIWTPLDQIPFSRMWADDEFWLARALSGDTFCGKFKFEGETICENSVVFDGAQSLWLNDGTKKLTLPVTEKVS